MRVGVRKILILCFVLWAAAMLALAPRFWAVHQETKNVEQTLTIYVQSLVNRVFVTRMRNVAPVFGGL
jgi:hypothetical protein